MFCYGSATLVVLAAAVALPFQNLFFSFEWLMGAQADIWSNYTILAMAIVCTGVAEWA